MCKSTYEAKYPKKKKKKIQRQKWKSSEVELHTYIQHPISAFHAIECHTPVQIQSLIVKSDSLNSCDVPNKDPNSAFIRRHIIFIKLGTLPIMIPHQLCKYCLLWSPFLSWFCSFSKYTTMGKKLLHIKGKSFFIRISLCASLGDVRFHVRWLKASRSI